ncbi:MAG: hypothetical protein AMXMBFR13_47500 [Phycisphaerae bacterium]
MLSSLTAETEPAGGELLTIGRIAEHLEAPLHVVRYALQRYPVPPRGRAGVTRVWSIEDLEAIRWAVDRVARNRRGVL